MIEWTLLHVIHARISNWMYLARSLTLVQNQTLQGVFGAMRRRHQRTLERMRAAPTPVDIRWAEIASLLNALGVTLVERAGSRVQLVRGSDSIVVHKPHPGPETRRDTVRDILNFIERIEGE